MTAGEPALSLTDADRRIARGRLGLEAAVLAALLVTMVPLLVLHALERTLPALAVAAAVPAAADQTALHRVEDTLKGAALRAHLNRPDPERTRELWAALPAEGEPPRLIEAVLWPAGAVDVEAVRASIAEIAPGAVVDHRERPSRAPIGAVAGALALAALGLLARWRLGRGVRRMLRGEATTMLLLHRFGATADGIDAEVAAPIRRRVRRGVAWGACGGAALGLGLVAAAADDLVRPWSGVATTVVLAAVLATALVVAGMGRVVAAATARRLRALGGRAG